MIPDDLETKRIRRDDMTDTINSFLKITAVMLVYLALSSLAEAMVFV